MVQSESFMELVSYDLIYVQSQCRWFCVSGHTVTNVDMRPQGQIRQESHDVEPNHSPFQSKFLFYHLFNYYQH